MRHADADADGARMDGMNGVDAAGANGEGMDVDGANGGSRGGGMNIDSAKGHECGWCKGCGRKGCQCRLRGAWGANAGAEGVNGATHGASVG